MATNTEGRITLVNPAGTGLLGVTEDRAVGRTLNEIEPDLARFISRDGSPTAENEIVLPKTGVFRIYDVQTVNISSECVTGGGSILTFRGVTDRKLAENALRNANRQFNLLSGIIRHDIKNKLTALFLYLDLAVQAPGHSDEAAFDRIRESAEGIRTLVDFTREFQDLGGAAPSWQNVGEIMAGAGSHLEHPVIRLINETGGLEIRAGRLFQRVIYNLLDNSLRYARDMTTFTIHSAQKDGRVILIVEDDGPGVAVENKERIFERGFGNNTGLGLFLTREILSISGITIRETGEPGQGARFELTIPSGAYRFPDSGEATD